MSTTTARPSSSLALWTGLLCLVLFGLLTAYIATQGDQRQEDPGRLKELGQADIVPVKVVPGDWPQWRGPRRDGVSDEKNLLAAWPEGGPKKLWSFPVGAGFSAPAIADGRLYLLFQDGADEAVVCLDTENGKELWRHRTPAKYRNDFGDGPRATPTVDGDLVYTLGGSGILTCLKTQPASPTGEVVWQRRLLEEFQAENLKWGISFSPLAHGDTLYINPGGRNGKSIAALDKRTGTTIWTMLDDPGGYSSPVAAELAGTEQIVFFTGAALVGVVPASGEVLWRHPWETSYDCNIATPIVAGDYVFISSGYRRGCTVLKIEKGEEGFAARRVYEHRKMCNHFSTCVLLDEHLYGFNDAFLTCMDFRTGKVQWVERGFDKGSLLAVGGKLIILGEYGSVALVQPDPKEYRELCRFEFSTKRCWTMPVVAQGRLYLRDTATLACFDLTGKN